MKIKIYVFIALVLLSLYACQSKPEEAIIGKWETDKEEMKKDLDKEIAKNSKENPIKAKAMEESIEALLEKIQINYEFRADGSMTMLSQGDSTKGKWAISIDGKVLTSVDANNQKTEASIIEISKSRLVLKIGSETYFFKTSK